MPDVSAVPPVFLVTHEFFPKRGGIATFTEEIAKASARLGYDIEVWAQSAPSGADRTWPFRLRRLPLRGTHDLACQVQLALQLVKERRRLRKATLYLPEPGPILAMMLLQFFHAFRPQRLVLTFHGSEILRFSRSPITRWTTGKLIARASRISTLSQFTQRLLLEKFPEAEGKVCLTPGAVRTDMALVPHERSDSPGKIIILTVGRLHPRKGQLETIRALAALAPEFRDRIEYWLVGRAKDDFETTVRNEAAGTGLHVRFFGDVPDDELESIYRRADIFAMTSIDHGASIEGFGLVYLEASAHGLPVVAHDVGGVKEAVLDGTTGLLVPPKRPAQLTAAFEKLITDPELRKRLGEAGREWAVKTRWTESAELLFDPAHNVSTADERG